MQTDAERTLGNLHVLAVLSHNDKLITNEDTFDIHTPTSLRALWRTWSGEGRVQNVTRVRSTVRAAIDFSYRSLADVEALRAGNHDDLRVKTAALQHLRMVDGVERARTGLGNLIQTYRDDAALASQIALVNEEIADFLEVMRPHSTRLAGVRGAPPGDEDRTLRLTYRAPPHP